MENVESTASEKKINLNIITPRGVKFTEKADMLVMRCIDGDLGVLPGHEKLSAVLGDGILRVYSGGRLTKIALFGGTAEIEDNSVNIYTTIAQRPEEIDRERAERDRQEAEESLKESSEEKQSRQLQVLLQRSLVRLEVSSYHDESNFYDDTEENDEEDE